MKYDPEKWALADRIKHGVEPLVYVRVTKSVALTYPNTKRQGNSIHVAELRDHDLIGVFKSHESMLAKATDRMLELRGKNLTHAENLHQERERLKRQIPRLRCNLIAIEQEIARRPSTANAHEKKPDK